VSFRWTACQNWKMKALTYVLVSLACALACVGLWGMLNVLDHTTAGASKMMPAFTSLVVSMRFWILLVPFPVIAFAIYALFRRSGKEESVVTFLACSISAICILAVPAIIALFLPCVLLMEQTWTR
jgi:hypothetical protein